MPTKTAATTCGFIARPRARHGHRTQKAGTDRAGGVGHRFRHLGFGGDSYGPVDDGQSRRVLEAAVERGVTFFDTSDLYGDGHAEEVLGRSLGDARSRVIIATKGGLLPHTGFTMPQDFSPAYLGDALHRSLERLRTDYVDLYQLHSPDLSALRENPRIMETLRGFKAQGLIRHYGLSARSPADAAAALAEFDFECTQVNYNLIDHRAAEAGTFAAVAATGAGLIARTPLCFGYLTGRLTGGENFAGRDHRANWPEDQLRRWAAAPGLFDSLIRRRGCTPAQFALLFCLAAPEVSTVIPGMMSLAELDENCAAASQEPLSAEEMAEIIDIYRSRTFYEPSAKARGKA